MIMPQYLTMAALVTNPALNQWLPVMAPRARATVTAPVLLPMPPAVAPVTGLALVSGQELVRVHRVLAPVLDRELVRAHRVPALVLVLKKVKLKNCPNMDLVLGSAAVSPSCSWLSYFSCYSPVSLVAVAFRKSNTNAGSLRARICI